MRVVHTKRLPCALFGADGSHRAVACSTTPSKTPAQAQPTSRLRRR